MQENLKRDIETWINHISFEILNGKIQSILVISEPI
jgi:hypothetical protein